MDSWCHPYERKTVILALTRNWNSIYLWTQKKLSTLGTGLPFREPSLAIVLISDIKSTYFLLPVKQLAPSSPPVLQVIIRSLEKRLTEKFLLSVPPKISKCLRLLRIFMSHNDNKLFFISDRHHASSPTFLFICCLPPFGSVLRLAFFFLFNLRKVGHRKTLLSVDIFAFLWLLVLC